MCHITDDTALSNSVIASNVQSGQQKMDQCVSDRLEPRSLHLWSYGLSHSLHKNGHEGLNQVSQEIQKGLNTNSLNENQDRVNIECSDHCERSKVKLIYNTKYCGFEDKFTYCILYANRKGSKGDCDVIDESIHQLWHRLTSSLVSFPCKSKSYQVLTFVQVVSLDLYSRYMVLSRKLGNQIFLQAGRLLGQTIA